MTSNPDQIRADIERTRSRLSNDVNELTDTVNPANVAKRQVSKARSSLTNAKDKVMGKASDLSDTVSGTVSDTGSSVGGAVAGAPSTVKQQASGNPLAAGIIAFGVGWLVSSLMPASSVEQQAAAKAKDAVLPEVQQAARNVAQELKEPAQSAAQEVQQAASEAVDAVKDEGRSAAGDVQDQAGQAKDEIQQSRS